MPQNFLCIFCGGSAFLYDFCIFVTLQLAFFACHLVWISSLILSVAELLPGGSEVPENFPGQRKLFSWSGKKFFPVREKVFPSQGVKTPMFWRLKLIGSGKSIVDASFFFKNDCSVNKNVYLCG